MFFLNLYFISFVKVFCTNIAINQTTKKNKIMKLILRISLAFLLFFLAISQSSAQKSDPYRKPEIWAKLLKDPNNRLLWTKYMKKRWSLMTKKDKADIEAMKQILYIESIADEESIIGVQKKSKSDEVFKAIALPKTKPDLQPNQVTTAEAKQLAHVEAIILEKPNEIEELKINITSNFVILEDKFKEVFADLGETYRYYHEVHPEGDYSELKWIEEQETKIKLIKEKQAADFRKQYVIVR